MLSAAEPKLLADPIPSAVGQAAADGVGEGTASIPFQAQALDGSDIALSDTRGAPTLLVFWAPW